MPKQGKGEGAGELVQRKQGYVANFNPSIKKKEIGVSYWG